MEGGNENAEIENLECNYQPLFFSVGTKWGGRSSMEVRADFEPQTPIHSNRDLSFKVRGKANFEKIVQSLNCKI